MQSEINLISEDASSKMGYMLNKYILLTVKQLSPGHHAVGLPVEFRVNLYILGEKMS